ncbi:hypothetical protein Golax_020655, partial [Gossypium laxum]|nr:hypothetical protein [Gossypium laxum]
STKKVRFKDKVEGSDRDSLVDRITISSVSWKDLLVSNSNPDSRRSVAPFGADADEDLDLLEGDIKKLFVNEKGYFLAKFQSKSDSDKVLFKGHWIIYGQYLMVQPWTMSFNLAQLFSSVVMVWIKLPDLLGYVEKEDPTRNLGNIWASSPVSISVNSMMVDEHSGETSGSYGPWMLVERSPRRKEMYETVDGDKGLSGTRSGPSGQLEKLDRVVIRSLGPKWVITLMSKRGNDTLYVVKAGRSHQAQLVDVEEIAGEELPSAVGDASIVRAGVSLIASIQLRTTHFNLTFEGPIEFVVQILEGVDVSTSNSTGLGEQNVSLKNPRQ